MPATWPRPRRRSWTGWPPWRARPGPTTEIRLLAAGARAAADLATLPKVARPRDIAELWGPVGGHFADRAQDIVAPGRAGSRPSPRTARWPPPNGRAS